ncbi:MAG: hypothetical protein AAF628_08615 [Planctomycetota bacterium]
MLGFHVALALLFVANRAPGTAAAATGFPLDDAWIHMVYGRSVAEHGLPYYNPGDAEAGFTSPLWVVALTLAHLLGAIFSAGPVALAKIAGTLCGAATTLGVLLLVWRLTQSRVATAFAALLAALCPIGAFAQVSGMEVTLCSAMAVWALVAYAHGRLWWTGTFVALAYLSRPELALLAIVLTAAALCARARPTARDKMRAAVPLVAPVAAAGSLWALYCWLAVGRPLPNTFYAKFDMGDATRIPSVLGEALLAVPANAWLAGIVLMALAVAHLYWLRDRVTATVLLIVPAALLFALARTRTFPPGFADYFAFYRYFAPVLPMMSAAMAIGLALPLRWATHETRAGRRRFGAAGLTIATLLAVVTLTPTAGRLAAASSSYAWHCQNMNEVQVALGHWVATETPTEAAVVVNDAGAIRYFGERRVIDLMGLNTGAFIDDPKDWGLVQGNAKLLQRFMRREGASHLIIFRPWFPALVQHEPHFSRLFEPVTHFTSPRYVVLDPRSGLDRMDVFCRRGATAAPGD